MFVEATSSVSRKSRVRDLRCVERVLEENRMVRRELRARAAERRRSPGRSTPSRTVTSCGVRLRVQRAIAASSRGSISATPRLRRRSRACNRPCDRPCARSSRSSLGGRAHATVSSPPTRRHRDAGEADRLRWRGADRKTDRRKAGRCGDWTLGVRAVVALYGRTERLRDRDLVDAVFRQRNADRVANSIRQERADADRALDPRVFAFAGFRHAEMNRVIPIRPFLLRAARRATDRP